MKLLLVLISLTIISAAKSEPTIETLKKVNYI